MIVNLNEVKQFLRVDTNDDDILINTLIAGAEQYLYNATGKIFDNTKALAKLFCMVLIVDWYDNRSLTCTSDKTRKIIDSILVQLTYSTSTEV